MAPLLAPGPGQGQDSVLTVGHVAPTHQHLHSRHTVADIWASSDSEQKWDSQCSDYHGIMSSVKDKIRET